MNFLLCLILVAKETWAQRCPYSRDCNQPHAYSSLSLHQFNLSTVVYVQSTNFKPEWKEAISTATDIIRRFHGTVQDSVIFLLEPSGTDSAYNPIRAAFAAFNYDQWNGERDINDAKNGGGKYFLSGRESCLCEAQTYTGAPVFYIPNVQDDTYMVAERALHEYTHAVQKTHPGPVPDWMMEGGAVYNECFFAQALDNSQLFSQCMHNHIYRVLELYENNNIRWFEKYAQDRCACQYCPNNYRDLDPHNKCNLCYKSCKSSNNINECESNCRKTEECRVSDGGEIYYPLGALATSLAIKYARERFGRSTYDFWNSKEEGFWHSVKAVELDPVSGFPSNVPEGSGWKKALADFTGFATYSEFVNAVEEVIRPGGNLNDIEQIKIEIFGESDDEVYSISQLEIDVTSSDFRSGPNNRCSTRRPTPFPQQLLTSSPTLQPTPVTSFEPTVEVSSEQDPGLVLCFPGDVFVEVAQQGFVLLKDLRIGDIIRVDKNRFEPVYSFGHRNSNVVADFLQIVTSNSPFKHIEISKDHMIFVKGGRAIPASQLKVGDVLQTVDSDRYPLVKSIKKVHRIGAYAPFTQSGSVFVNGIKASTFISIQNSENLQIGGWITIFSHQWLAHTFELPHRLWCLSRGFPFCADEHYNSEGLPASWIAVPYRIFSHILS